VALRLAADAAAIVLRLHHIVGDGWSLAVLQAEVATLYRAFSAGRPSPLPELAVQIADFAVWQRRLLAAGEEERLLAYWRERLGDRPEILELPADRPRPAVLDRRGWPSTMLLEGADAEAVRKLARGTACTTAMVLLAALDALLHRYSGRTDLLVSTVFSARDRP